MRVWVFVRLIVWLGSVIVFAAVMTRRCVARVREHYVDGRGRNTALTRLVDPVLDLEGVSNGLEDGGISAGIEERGEQHIAACAHSAIECEDVHSYVAGGTAKNPSVRAHSVLTNLPNAVTSMYLPRELTCGSN